MKKSHWNIFNIKTFTGLVWEKLLAENNDEVIHVQQVRYNKKDKQWQYRTTRKAGDNLEHMYVFNITEQEGLEYFNSAKLLEGSYKCKSPLNKKILQKRIEELEALGADDYC